ncbi:MAG: ABC transporter permease [Deltaproteobacteria bacterium]|nr:MAG: ABC transporter permease [Deltaproteobacteria bacterium]
MMVWRLAFRNLVRNGWRTGLTAGGIAVAVALLIFLSAWITGMARTMVASATEAGVGHVLVEAAVGEEAHTLHDAFAVDEAQLDAIAASPLVERVAPRIESFGLLGDEERSQVVRVSGVDPVREGGASSVFARSMREGEWFGAQAPSETGPREVVLGHGLAQVLRVGVGDELVFFTQAADGSLGNDVARVRGIVRTGQSAVDRMTVFFHLEDARWLLALEGQAHQLVVLTPSVYGVVQQAEVLAAHVGEVLGLPVHRAHGPESTDGVVLRTWGEVAPMLAEMVDLTDAMAWIFYFVLFFLAGFGIVNTQRMSVLERRREFGILLAVGMRARLLAKMIVAETVLLGLVGALAGLVLGVGVTALFGHVGIDFSVFTAYEGDIEVLGLQLGEPMYPRVSDARVALPVVVIGLLSAFFALPAALRTLRLDAVRAISGRT